MKELNNKDALKKQLEQENNILKSLQQQLEVLQKKKTAHDDARTKAIELRSNISSQLDTGRFRRTQLDDLIAEATPETRGDAFNFLRQNRTAALDNTVFTLENIDKLQRVYAKWLQNKRDSLERETARLNGVIVEGMTGYRNTYVSETKEMDSRLESLPEYKKILDQLQLDGLPKFERRFKDLLTTNALHQIALFQAKLKKEQDTIRQRINQINGSLSTIDYNEGRYIRLEYEEAYDSEIKDFRARLRACTEGALTGSGDDQYAEAKFLQVKEIIDRFRGRPGETDIDARWKNKVVDVRNWYLFFASERFRETDEEYEFYKDSGGKSGGQKEKLAYTILAASLVYHFGLEEQDQSFRFVVIDEAFLKSSDESARFGLELFKKMNLQLLIVTPLLKIQTIAQYISHVGFVHHDDLSHKSMLRNISVEEYVQERKMREALRNVKVV